MDIWNEQPEEIVEAGPITAVITHLDRDMARIGLERCWPNSGKWD